VIGFILDNSVTMRWHLASNKPNDQRYCESVLLSLAESEAIVPNLWHLEASNVLLGAERRGDTTAGEAERFIVQLENLPLHIDTLTAHQAFSRTMALARAYKLSSYDAAYLELAIREGFPLATLDQQLSKAAREADVEIYLKET